MHHKQETHWQEVFDMRGHDKIIHARIRGIKPMVVNILDFPYDLELEDSEVVVYPDDLISLDLRFIVDCFVTISSDSQERLDKLVKICESCKPRQIAAGLRYKYY